MAFEIEWTPNAREDLREIVSYLQKEWSAGIAENFIVDCFSKINLIAQFPYIGAPSEKIKLFCSIFLIHGSNLIKTSTK